MSAMIILAGDGAELAHKSTGEKYELAPYILRYQRGSGVCYAAQGKELIDRRRSCRATSGSRRRSASAWRAKANR